MSRFYEQIMGVYFDDLDMFGILHNARYILLFERTLGSFWQHLGYGSLASEEHPDQLHLVRANHIEYHAPMEGTGQVRVRVWVERFGRTSLAFGFRIMPMDEDRDLATGTRVIVRIDRHERRPVPWTQAFRERVAPWVATYSESEER